MGRALRSTHPCFIYDVSSGYLFYDSDGIGDNKQVKIAQLDFPLNLDNKILLIGLI